MGSYNKLYILSPFETAAKLHNHQSMKFDYHFVIHVKFGVLKGFAAVSPLRSNKCHLSCFRNWEQADHAFL